MTLRRGKMITAGRPRPLDPLVDHADDLPASRNPLMPKGSIGALSLNIYSRTVYLMVGASVRSLTEL